MAITKKDLEYEVAQLNEKYCKKTGNELRVAQAYGGYQVQLTGKRRKDGKGYRGMGSGASEITYGYLPARETLANLHKQDARGWVKETISIHEKRNHQKKPAVRKKKVSITTATAKKSVPKTKCNAGGKKNAKSVKKQKK